MKITKLTNRARWALYGAFTALLLSSLPAVAQEDEELEAFMVTGSRIARIDLEGPSPLRVIGREEIEISGRTNLTDLLRDLPEASAIGINEAGTITAVRGATALDLRNLGPNNTLVIVNGRRTTVTGNNSGGNTFVDLNRFPISMIERIEVLKDGASAIYGADATAGVVNIILRKDFEGLEMSYSYGDSFTGSDEAEQMISVFGGASGARARATLGFQYFKRNALAANDRSFANNADLTERYRARGSDYYVNGANAGWWDLRSGTGPFARIGIPTAAQLAANGITSPQINPLTGSPVTTLPGTTLTSASPKFTNPPKKPTAADFIAQSFVAGPASNLYNYQQFVWLVPETERKSGYGTFAYDITDDIEFYAEFSFTRNDTQTRLAPSPISTAGDNSILVPASNYYNPFGIAVNFNYRPIEIGPRIADIANHSYSYVAGLKGIALDTYEWDVSYSYSYDEVTDTTTNAMSESLLRKALAKNTPDAVNVFGGPNANSQAVMDSIRVRSSKGGNADLQLLNASVSTAELVSLPTGAIGAAFYTEYREENFVEANDDISNKLDDIIGQVRLSDPTAAYRNVYAVAAEVRVPLIKENEYRFAQKLELSAAARFEDFSDGYDSDVKPSVGLAFRPVKSLLLRASYNKNFRAPSLPQLYGGERQSLPNNLADWARPQALTGDPFDGASTQRLVRSGGNPNLAPETAVAKQVGFVYELPFEKLRGLSIGATYGNIEQTNIITTISTTFIRNNEFGDAAGLITRDSTPETYTNTTASPITVYKGPGSRLDPAANVTVNPGQTVTVPGRIQSLSSSYLNLAQQKVRYIDVELSYDKTTDTLGRFRFSTTWTFLDYYGFVSTAGNPMFDYVGTDGYPKWRGQTVLSWTKNEWAASLINNYAHKYATIDVDGFDVGKHYTFGASVSYDLPIMDNATVTLYVDNILDRDPPLYYDGIGYDGSMISRPQGRFYYLTLKKSF